MHAGVPGCPGGCPVRMVSGGLTVGWVSRPECHHVFPTLLHLDDDGGGAERGGKIHERYAFACPSNFRTAMQSDSGLAPVHPCHPGSEFGSGGQNRELDQIRESGITRPPMSDTDIPGEHGTPSPMPLRSPDTVRGAPGWTPPGTVSAFATSYLPTLPDTLPYGDTPNVTPGLGGRAVGYRIPYERVTVG